MSQKSLCEALTACTLQYFLYFLLYSTNTNINTTSSNVSPMSFSQLLKFQRWTQRVGCSAVKCKISRVTSVDAHTPLQYSLGLILSDSSCCNHCCCHSDVLQALEKQGRPLLVDKRVRYTRDVILNNVVYRWYSFTSLFLPSDGLLL